MLLIARFFKKFLGTFFMYYNTCHIRPFVIFDLLCFDHMSFDLMSFDLLYENYSEIAAFFVNNSMETNQNSKIVKSAKWGVKTILIYDKTELENLMLQSLTTYIRVHQFPRSDSLRGNGSRAVIHCAGTDPPQ